MKKVLFTLLAITVLSCSSSDDNNPVAVAPNIQLQKMEVKSSDGSVKTTEYTYENNHLSQSKVLDSDGTVVKRSTYSYTNDQLIKKANFDTNGDPTDVESFVYKDNKIVSTSHLADKESYLYNDLGQVIKLQHSQDGTTSDLETYEYDAAGNLIKYTNSSNISISFTFDNKKTVASLLYPQAVLKIPLFATPGNNNVTKEDYGSDGVVTYDYEYNAAGYPTKKIQKIDGTVNQEITYFYNQ